MKKHTRINDIALGFLERPALQFLARKMPSWVNPDILTGLGLLAALLVGVSYYLTNFNNNFLWLASFGLIINWFGDSLDGTLARYRKIERPRYGFFLDHIVDSISEIFIFLGIGLSPLVDYKLASLVLIGYLCLSILIYLTTYVEGVFKISYGKMGPTEIRVIAIIANTVIYFLGNFDFNTIIGAISLYNIIAGFVAFLLFSFFLYTATKNIILLSKEDRKK
jgi:phosphatidylglycerophosphate synthase